MPSRVTPKHPASHDPADAYRALVFHDQSVTVDMIRLTLDHGVFETRSALTEKECVRALREWQPHIALLDLELVTEGLLSLLGPQPGGGFKIPVFGLTRRGDLKTKLEAFDMGVDDIMSMPISPEELLARTLAVVRRAYGVKLPLRPVMRIDDIDFDILARRVTVGDSELHLTSLEQSLLYLLSGSKGRVVTRDEIMDALWGHDYVSESNVVDRHIRNLRAKLQNDWRRPRFIATVPGLGYRFLPDGSPGEGED